MIDSLQGERAALDEVLTFWFAPEHRSYWFASTAESDQLIHDRFESLWLQLRDHSGQIWKQSARCYLALVIVMDQFPLNMYRGQARAFSTEAQAVQLAKEAITRNIDDDLSDQQVAFLYMPLMHSECLEDQQLSLQLFSKRNLQENLRFAKHHHDLILRFGRFPHRNVILGRNSTREELDYLASKEAFLG